LIDQRAPDDKAAWLALFGDELHKHPEFSNLAQEVIEEVAERFSGIEKGDGELQRAPGGWPGLWTIKSDDRARFLAAVRWFSSNHHAQFGRLLTPLVNGIRVKGRCSLTTPKSATSPSWFCWTARGLDTRPRASHPSQHTSPRSFRMSI